MWVELIDDNKLKEIKKQYKSNEIDHNKKYIMFNYFI